MKGCYHFVTGNFKLHATWMSDEECGMVRDNAVRGSVDCIVVNNGKILLGKRTHEPHPDWWIIGGKIIPGESPKKAMGRKLNEELGLEKIKPSRFRLFGIGSFAWSRRAEPPQENGCHDLSVIMILEISDEEAEKIEPKDEYEKVDWFNPKFVAKSQDFHSAVKTFAKELFALLEQRK